jgi:hypothetical protein
LKNHALLLFGPSSFEHWFKGCKSFSVRSLLFSEIANQSSVQFLPLLPPGATAPLLCFWFPLPPAQYFDSGRRRPPPVPPLPRVASPSSHRSSPFCWCSTRAPRPPLAASTARRSSCRRRNTHASMPILPPLFGSIAPVAPPRFICPDSLLAQLAPSPSHLRRPTHLSGELWVTVGRHIQATTARTEPSRGFPGACRCFPAPGRLLIPAEEPPRPAPPATAPCPPWAGHLGHPRALKTLRPASLCSSETSRPIPHRLRPLDHYSRRSSSSPAACLRRAATASRPYSNSKCPQVREGSLMLPLPFDSTAGDRRRPCTPVKPRHLCVGPAGSSG